VRSLLVFACIAPHGGVSIASLGNPAAARAEGTRQAMADLRSRAREAGVDTWVVLGPHGLWVDGHMAVSDGEHAISHIQPEGKGGEPFSFSAPVERDLARTITAAGNRAGVPSILVGHGDGNYPMDWSGSIPLAFLGAGEGGSRVVQVVPCADLGFDAMVAYGEALYPVLDAHPGRVGLVASSDLGHGHDAAGPYGYTPASEAYDRQVVEAVGAGDILRLRALDPAFVHEALVDGQWQILILAGVLQRWTRRTELLCYEVPTYFGMLTAAVV